MPARNELAFGTHWNVLRLDSRLSPAEVEDLPDSNLLPEKHQPVSIG
jgi:hypothetical protein